MTPADFTNLSNQIRSIEHGVDRLRPSITQRDYFAAAAMQAIITADDAPTIMKLANDRMARPEDVIAQVAVDHADALIEALNQEK